MNRQAKKGIPVLILCMNPQSNGKCSVIADTLFEESANFQAVCALLERFCALVMREIYSRDLPRFAADLAEALERHTADMEVMRRYVY